MSGKLIGVARVPPMFPALVIEKVLPFSVRADLAGAGALREVLELGSQLEQALALDAADDRDDQAVGRVGRDPQVDGPRQHDVAGRLVEVAVEHAVLHEAVRDGLHEEGHEGDLDTLLRPQLLGLLAHADQLGDVDLLDDGEVRRGLLRADHRLRDLAANAPERDALLGGAGRREGRGARSRSRLGRRRGGRRRGRSGGGGRGGEGLHVRTADHPVAAGAGDWARSMPSSRATRRALGTARTLASVAGAGAGVARRGSPRPEPPERRTAQEPPRARQARPLQPGGR